MSGNIRVVCRFRPQNSKEVKANGKVVVDFLDDQTVHLNVCFLQFPMNTSRIFILFFFFFGFRVKKQIISLHLIVFLFLQILRKMFMIQLH